MKNLDYYIKQVRKRFPNYTESQVLVAAQSAYESDPDSTYKAPKVSTGKAPKPTFDISAEEEGGTGISLGFGTDGVAVPMKMSSYVIGLMKTNPKAYANIKNAVKSATGKTYNDPTALGSWVARFAENMYMSNDPIVKNLTIEDFLRTSAKYRTETGKTRQPTGTVSISTPERARAKVLEIAKKEGIALDEAQVKDLANKLMAKEQKPSSIQKAVTEEVDGVLVTKYTVPFDKDQYLTDLIQKLPAYSQKQASAQQSAQQAATQALAQTAAANGFNLMKDFGGSAQDWIQRVQNGEDINIFKNAIRQTAKLGLPDKVGALLDQGIDLETVYSPYRRQMASLLEVNPDAINLDDPLLRSAIGPDKEMSLYEFKRAIRKDPRWQNTDNAREEVSNIALSVLRDLGFQG